MSRPAQFMSALAGAVALVFGLSGTAAAQGERAVVELFTSQGCSSCPPADKLFVELAKERDIIALTLPVDYWDYLGWKDTLASPVFSARQKAYAHLRGDNQVYTPQAVVNGSKHALGTDRAAIMRAASYGLPVSVTISEASAATTVTVAGATVGAAVAGPTRGSLWLVPVSRSRQVVIQRGENRGKTITYANVALGLHKLGEWGGDTATFAVPTEFLSISQADGFVVLLQSEGHKIGKILGAARSRALLPPAI